MDCGLPPASSVIWAFAARTPVAVGENVTVIVHVAFAASEPGDRMSGAKGTGVAPTSVMPVMVSGAVPVSFTIDDCDALVEPTSCDANVRLVGVSITAGAGVVPLPLSGMVWGVPGASSAMLTLAARPPETVGENVTVIVHVAFAASEP